jgi:hypothetical protein
VSDLFTHNDGPSEEDQRTPAPPLQTSIERPFHLNDRDTVLLPTLDPSKLAPMPESRSSLIPTTTSEGGAVTEGPSGKTTSHEVYPSPTSLGSNFVPLDGPAERMNRLSYEDAAFNMFQSHSMISNLPVDNNFLETATLDMWSSAPTSMVYVAFIFLVSPP